MDNVIRRRRCAVPGCEDRLQQQKHKLILKNVFYRQSRNKNLILLEKQYMEVENIFYELFKLTAERSDGSTLPEGGIDLDISRPSTSFV
ncbi:hypothetical protein NQ318_009413 [Aromia moschata]|uniref:Uncharacterized protein n=1 Tax=Aromia moschata TaxID=1265417 RepID=A0AAV8Z819_9CUCU|nr:hypothetical protein NQ318_009413 [Aromia moschata]